jgi:8-oxo-dGTP pyrophosphatase MutT (NUDIX family)
MKKVTLCYCVRNKEVLLGMKRCGFGVGKWNGYGGKVKDGESPKQAAIRELGEESGLVADQKDLKQCSLIRFYFEQDFAFECYVYLISNWTGEPIETKEMSPK